MRSCLGARSAGPALAADECSGLPICLPWRARGSSCPPAGVDYELTCPIAGYVVAGTDARVAAKDVDVSFRGEPGSPVGPGVTTRRSVVFHAVRTRVGAGSTSFQPFIGCVPTRGGGGRALTGLTGPSAGFKPTPSLRSVVVDNPVRQRLAHGEGRLPARDARLVGSTHAVAFRQTCRPLRACSVQCHVRRSVIERRRRRAGHDDAVVRGPGGGAGSRGLRGGAMTFGSPILLVSLLVPLAALACYLWLEKRPPRAGSLVPEPRGARGGRRVRVGAAT